MKKLTNGRKLIEGKLYDINKSKIIGTWDNGLDENDSEYCTETLFIKNSGEYFLYGKGGQNSKYTYYRGSYTTGSERLFPFTYQEAKDWAEEHLEVGLFTSHFVIAPTDDESIRQLNVRISDAAYKILTKMASETGKSRQYIIEELIRNSGNGCS